MRLQRLSTTEKAFTPYTKQRIALQYFQAYKCKQRRHRCTWMNEAIALDRAELMSTNSDVVISGTRCTGVLFNRGCETCSRSVTASCVHGPAVSFVSTKMRFFIFYRSDCRFGQQCDSDGDRLFCPVYQCLASLSATMSIIATSSALRQHTTVVRRSDPGPNFLLSANIPDMETTLC